MIVENSIHDPIFATAMWNFYQAATVYLQVFISMHNIGVGMFHEMQDAHSA